MPATFGTIGSDLSIAASYSVRRNATDTGWEAYDTTTGSGANAQLSNLSDTCLNAAIHMCGNTIDGAGLLQFANGQNIQPDSTGNLTLCDCSGCFTLAQLSQSGCQTYVDCAGIAYCGCNGCTFSFVDCGGYTHCSCNGIMVS
jgi:hypothetical protein